MVSRGRLLARAVALDQATSGTSLTADLVGLRLEVAGHRDFCLPRHEHPPWVDAAVTQAEEWLPGLGAQALRQTLLRPARVYELEAVGDQRRVAVLAAVNDQRSEPYLVRGVLEARTAGKRLADCGNLELTGAPLSTQDARELLAEVATELTRPSLAAPDPDGVPPAALVVGDASASERDAIRRQLWSHGVRVEDFLDQPYRRTHVARSRVQSFKGELLVLNVPGCQAEAGALIGAAGASTAPLLLLHEGDLQYLLLELDDELDNRSVDVPLAPVPEPPGTPPAGWKTAARCVRSLQRDDGSFVLTKKCSAGLEKTPYPHPAHMVDQLEKLSRLAVKWAERKGRLECGFEDWARAEEGLEIAWRDKKLVRLKLDSFQHENRTFSREPHVQPDDAKAFTECGRIYFAVDNDPYRFIVDHIGLHLYR
jgi:hypothetical protein